MAKTEHYYTKFEDGRFYHVFNRAVDRKPLFYNDGNYKFFLQKYDEYLSDVVDTYSYCLLGNHFHLLVKVRENNDLITSAKLSNPKKQQGQTEFKNSPEINPHEIVSRQFRKFFQSYAMAFNNQQSRIGTLFQTPFKRVLVDSDSYFTTLVYYIHANPQLHGLVDDFRDWQWSSYDRMLMDKPTKLKKQEVLDWFAGREKYAQYHAENHLHIKNDRLFLEDDN